MPSRARWIGLLFISIAVSLIIVDSTIVNVAIPSIVAELAIDSTQVQWVQEAYTLVFAAFLIPFGTLADRIGRRRLLVIGVIVFTVASVMAGLAPDGALLITARVVQGFGGAMVLPATMSLINAGFRGRERAIAFAVWGSTIGGMAAVGPLLGGWLTTDFSWRWAFGVNVPFGIAVVIGVYFTVVESSSSVRTRLDLLGAALAVLGSGSLVFALIEGRRFGWWDVRSPIAVGEWTWPLAVSPTPFILALSVLAIAGFIAWQRRRRRRGEPTMLPLKLFAIPSFRNGNLVAMIVSLGELGLLFVLPLWLQNVLRYDPLQTGFILLALAIGSFLASGLVSGLSRRLSAVDILRIGVGLEFVAVLTLALVISVESSWQLLAVILFAYGLGLGLASAQVTNVVLADVPIDESGRASGTQSTARQIGSALGIAILGTLLFESLAVHLEQSLAGIPGIDANAIAFGVVDSAGAGIPALLVDPATAEVGRLAGEAFTGATSVAGFAAAAFLGVAFLASLLLRRRGPAEAASTDAVAMTPPAEA